MFEIAAPFPLIDTVLRLPNPEFSDSEALADEVISKRAIDGTLYTHVKTKGGRRTLLWEFHVSRTQGLECEAFLRQYLSQRLRVTDHNGRVWIGHILNNPIDLRTDKRAGPPSAAWPVGERQSFTIQFEGVES